MFSFTFDEKEYTLSEDKLLYFFNEDVEGFDIDKLFEILNSSEGVSFGKAYYDGPCEGLTYNKLLRDKKVDKSYLVNINVCKNCGNFAVEVEELEV